MNRLHGRANHMGGWGRTVAIFWAMISMTAVPSPASAQFGIQASTPDDEEETSRTRVDEGTDIARDLRLAKNAVAQKDYTTGLRILQDILDRSEDYFVDQEMSASYKGEALNQIRSLPAEGREQYELQYGQSARQHLAQAHQSGNWTKVEAVARRYFHSNAGYEATYQVGSWRMMRGESFAAAKFFEALRSDSNAASRFEPALSLKTAVCWHRIGRDDRARTALAQLKSRWGNRPIVIGGKEHALFKNEEHAVSWLVETVGTQKVNLTRDETDWLLFRGDATRNSQSHPAAPVDDTAWTYSLLQFERDRLLPNEEQVDIAAEVERLSEAKRQSSFLMLPAVHPIIVGNRVVTRALDNVRALDLDAGVDPHKNDIAWTSYDQDRMFKRLIVKQEMMALPGRAGTQAPPLESFLTQRLWQDLTTGTLSSDGEQIYVVEDTGFIGVYTNRLFGQPHPFAPGDSSRLVALDMDGKLRWEIGGPSGELAVEHAGTFFLGPPLPGSGQLFCLAENRGEILLLVLDPEEGTTLWRQTIVLPESPLSQSESRRQAGLSPTFGDGVLICPTCSGAVVAVDPSRRQLLWGYRYDSEESLDPRRKRIQMINRGRFGLAVDAEDEENRWIDSAPTVAHGCVLLTPRDSDELHCLNLDNGERLWSRPRGQGLYVAGVHQGKVIVVGQAQIEAFHLLSGKRHRAGEMAWSEPTLIPRPSGRGFRHGSFYSLPLSTAEIATIDLDTGRILSRSKTKSGKIPGNLVSVNGRIISQSIDSVRGFRPLDEMESEIESGLQEDPNDSAALALRGEIRLHSGDAAGLADLRRAVELDEHPRAKDVLLSALMEGMRIDFGQYQKFSNEIESLCRGNAEAQSRYLQLYAEGLQQIGQRLPAFERYLELAGLDTDAPTLERVNGVLTARGDRWVRPRLTEVYRDASPTERAKMDEVLQSALDEALASENSKRLKRLLAGCAELPPADRIRHALWSRMDDSTGPLAEVMILNRLSRSADDQFAGEATARLAALYIELNRPQSARDLVRQIESKWADVVCLDDKTGSEMIALWKDDSDWADVFHNADSWPNRKFEVDRDDTHRVNSYYPVEFEGPRGREYEDWSLHIAQNPRQLQARDGLGRRIWDLSLDQVQDQLQRRQVVSNLYGNRAISNDHLIVVSLGHFFVVFNPLVSPPDILWSGLLYDAAENFAGRVPFQINQIMLPNGQRRVVLRDPLNRPLGTVGPLSDDAIVWQVGRTLKSADPLTGAIFWQREFIPRGSHLVGDEKHVFVMPPNGGQIIVLRAADGEEVTVTPLPKGQILSTIKRTVVLEDSQNDATIITGFDAVTGETLWQKSFAANSHAAVVEGEELFVLEPQGKMTLLSLPDGKQHSVVNVEPDKRLKELFVIRSRTGYVVFTYSPQPNQPVPRAPSTYPTTRAVHGFAYGLDRETGELNWTTRIENQTIDLSQPEDLPVMVFTVAASQLIQRNIRHRYETEIRDRRTGELIHTIKDNNSVTRYQFRADPEAKTIHIDFFRSSLKLSMSNEPLPDSSEPAKQP